MVKLAEIFVIAVAFVGKDRMKRVVKVIVPLGVQSRILEVP